MDKIKKMFNSIYAKIGVAALALGALIQGKAAHAAADSDLQAGLASTTAIFTDNKGMIILWIVGIFAVTIVVGLLLRALFFGKRQALGMFGSGRRRR